MYRIPKLKAGLGEAMGVVFEAAGHETVYVAGDTIWRSEVDQAIHFVPMEKLKRDSISLDEEKQISEVFDGYTYFLNEDILLAKVTPCFENKNIAIAKNLVNGIGFGSTEIYVLRANDQTHNRFMFYRLQENNFMTIAISSMTGAGGLKRVPSDILLSHSVACPSFKEQNRIANFLDYETAKIDSLIAKQEKLIELLKEKRQAVISHAVTKGLNPDVNMKDSGVEWLGQVPEHWTVKSYRHASKIYRGKFGHRPRNDPAFYDGEYPFIQTGDVARAGKYITSYSQTLNEKGKEVSQLFPKGTLMMAIAANIGDLAILGFEAYAPDSVVGFKPNQDIDLEFLRYSFMAALPALEQISTQSTQANLNVERIGAVQGVFPSLNDQQEIVSYLDEMLNKYSVIEREMHKAIELLQERRTALISSAVTGKIDVRNWQNPNKNNEANTEFGA
ncbi:restriction endonuclease subunit S [Acinetobacter johnsonii]|uniref:restriction endonuclease subunit S n=1 Tax=Acinetobacter johnsonii TaxID=40214 RepID=UPI00244CD585|nr:restriction endonuclease subunit S [Acinetobacter johnsonii]MDH1489252.1 restriction endonuclease subunit S [Acinetobacter johnsonii]MDH1615184.1 restriction endonuclease subunit S [Acinetobacter johnsonii]